MIECALNAVHKLNLGREMDLPLSVGFGCHIGEVLYGNIELKRDLISPLWGRC